MKKLFSIFGHIYPLNFTPFNGISKNAFSKSITLSQKFQEINFSLFNKNPGIIPELNESGHLAEIFCSIVSAFRIVAIDRKECLHCNHAGSNDMLRLTKTHQSNFTIPAFSIPEYKTINNIPGTMCMFSNKYQNTF